jgi:transcriptional regulator with XRE-family HTH domain
MQDDNIAEKAGEILGDLCNMYCAKNNMGIKSNSEIAERIGVSSSTLSDHIHGKKIMGIDKAVQYARFFGVKLEYLFGVDESRLRPFELFKIMESYETLLTKEALDALRRASDETRGLVNALLESRHFWGTVKDVNNNLRDNTKGGKANGKKEDQQG